MPEIVQRFVRRLPDMLFPRTRKEVRELLQTPLPAPTPEEAWRQDFQTMGDEMRRAMGKAVHE